MEESTKRQIDTMNKHLEGIYKRLFWIAFWLAIIALFGLSIKLKS